MCLERALHDWKRQKQLKACLAKFIIRPIELPILIEMTLAINDKN